MLTTQIDNLIDSGSASQKADFQTKFAIFLLYGFSFLGRLFVFISFPLSAFILFDRKILFDRVYAALTKRGPLTGLTWVLLLSTMYGVAEVVYGAMSGYSPVTALEILAFNFCPWFLYFGLRAGSQRPFVVRDYIRFFAWFHAITTPIYFLFLRHITLNIPGTDTALLQPGSGSLILIGLFCYERDLSRYWFPIVVCSFETIASQIRADWLGLVLVLVIWGFATKRMQRVLSIAGIITIFMLIGLAADIRIPAIPGRGGEISARDTIGRALSGIDPEMAQEYSTNAGTYAGTVQWRETWWKAIREKVFELPTTTAFGLGYGYPIKDLVPYLKTMDIRSPHSVFYFTLSYSGFVGVFIFLLLQTKLLALLWRTFKETGELYGFLSLLYLLVGSMLGNFFESPQSSVPAYIILGMCIGPMLTSHEENKGMAAVKQQRFASLGQPGPGMTLPLKAVSLYSRMSAGDAVKL